MRLHHFPSIFCSLAVPVVVPALAAYPAHYSYGFIQPVAPLINTEFTANIMQHKYNVNVSNIFAGQIYQSLSNSKVRVDAAYEGKLLSSIFDFTNTSSTGGAGGGGLIGNYIFAYTGSITTTPECTTYYVAPGFPLFASDILQTSGSVYLGVVRDDMYGPVSAWEILYGGVLVTVYLDQNNTFVRYDFEAPGDLRTYTTTRFFNIHFTNISADIFSSPCNSQK